MDNLNFDNFFKLNTKLLNQIKSMQNGNGLIAVWRDFTSVRLNFEHGLWTV